MATAVSRHLSSSSTSSAASTNTSSSNLPSSSPSSSLPQSTSSTSYCCTLFGLVANPPASSASGALPHAGSQQPRGQFRDPLQPRPCADRTLHVQQRPRGRLLARRTPQPAGPLRTLLPLLLLLLLPSSQPRPRCARAAGRPRGRPHAATARRASLHDLRARVRQPGRRPSHRAPRVARNPPLHLSLPPGTSPPTPALCCPPATTRSCGPSAVCRCSRRR